ncbi:MAG: hypothetical protein CGW95_13845 [Phenylobacterium zucineum]|nr:MAG: hypothetical protein CGW95_13845 [Phenylobacterium zucineum]
MKQLNLFEPERPNAAPAEPNIPLIRKHLMRAVRTVRAAERMPWGPAETRSWTERFPGLADCLPEEEGQVLLKVFETEMARLRAHT